MNKLKGTIWTMVPLMLATGVASAWVLTYSMSVFANEGDAMCRRRIRGQANLLGEEMTKAFNRNTYSSNLDYEFTACVSSFSLKRLPAPTVKEEDQGGGPMGVVVNFTSRTQNWLVNTSCTDLKLAGRGFSGQSSLEGIPGGNSYKIRIEAVEEEEGKLARVNLTNLHP